MKYTDLIPMPKITKRITELPDHQKYLERFIRLRDYLLTVNRSKFSYRTFIDWTRTCCHKKGHENIHPDHNCYTVACLAGHCCLLFKLDIQAPDVAAASYLGLPKLEAGSDTMRYFLFYAYMEHANRDDAIRRLNWLIDGNDFTEYPWHCESYTAETTRETSTPVK